MIKKLDEVTTRDKIQFTLAGLLMVFGCVMLMIGLWIEPAGQIHSSLLVAFGEVGTLAASILGIDAVFTNKLQKIVTSIKDAEGALKSLDKKEDK